MAQAAEAGLRILYFAWLRERAGRAAETVNPPAGVDTVAGLMDWLAGLDDQHAAAFAQRQVIRAAINQEFAQPGDAVRPGDEVAFFPPVTGG